MYTFTIQCPNTGKLSMVTRNNYVSANVLERQLRDNSIPFQLHNTIQRVI